MEKDTLQRFLIENTQVRGERVHLDKSWQAIRDCADYPQPLQNLLGQAAAAVCLLAATMKFEGSMILQISGSGPVNMLVMQASSEGAIRGMANWEGDVNSESLIDLFGEGQIAISVVTDNNKDRYQGIIELKQVTLSACLEDYFTESEQLKTYLHLTADENIAAGLLLQRLPGDAKDEDGWERSLALTQTTADEELLTLNTKTLLQRLFHEEDLRLFDAEEMYFECTCSQQKVETMIYNLGKEQAKEIILQQGKLEIACDFCNTNYTVNEIDLEGIFSHHFSSGSQSIH